nr:MAG TPA: hypothetical protein [Caudoviricetes sp.]
MNYRSTLGTQIQKVDILVCKGVLYNVSSLD